MWILYVLGTLLVAFILFILIMRLIDQVARKKNEKLKYGRNQ